MLIRKILLVSFFTFALFSAHAVSAQPGSPDEYTSTVKKADEYFKKGDYINAKTSYQYASRLNPDEQYPKDRLQQTVAKLREKMARMDEYTAVLTEADSYYRKKEYDKAIEQYRKASTIIPAEGYPEEKISEIEGAKDAERKKQIDYDDAIYRADKFVKYRKYEEAIEAYRKAAEILPGEEYPRDQIAELEVQLETLVEARNAYQSIIDNADRLYSLKYYENARGEYRKAADARPDDDYPVSMIKEIDQLLVKKGEFDKLVEEGDTQYMNKNLPFAKQKYQEALKIYPSESYPRGMIDKINLAMKDQISPAELYEVAIANADKFLASSDYANALQEYGNASDLKPGESYPRQKMDEVNAILLARKTAEEDYAIAIKTGDQYLNAGSYTEAKIEFEKALTLKPAESYPAERLAMVMEALKEQEAVLASYQRSIDKANTFYDAGAYDQAVESYNAALVIIPGDQFASERIKEIDQLKNLEQATAIAYTRVIAEADKLFGANDLVGARMKYEQALGMDDSQAYPNAQIAEIDSRMNSQRELNAAYSKAIATADIFYNKKEYARAKEEYEKASALKPNESYPKTRIGELSAAVVVVTQQDDEYDKAIREADGLMGMQEYAKARLLYMKAANMRPKELYPKNKIEEIDAIVGKQESDQAEYNRLVAAADRMMESGDYAMAEERYNQALAILPVEQYPREKLKEIESLILANELDKQKAYNGFITEADKAFDQQEYATAKIKYQNALKYKPGESHPVQRLAEIEVLAADLKQLQDNYNRLILEADNAFTSKEYQVAKTKYAEASNLFPEEEHPRVRLEEINVIIRSSNQNAMQAYDKTISDADKFFSSGAYGQALDSYRNAQSLMPEESYPVEMIDKIMKILNDNAFRKLLTSSKSIQNNEVEKFSFEPISVTDRKSSILLIRVRGMGIRDFKVFVSYGKGGSKNGGFIMPVPGGEDMKEYVFELGNQYTWFSEDNNWISLTPQGGSIEVSLVEIAKSAIE